MRKILTALTVAFALLIPTGPAFAAEPAAAAPGSGTASGGIGIQSYVDWETYPTRQDCEFAGSFGLGLGDWDDYFCVDLFDGSHLNVHFPEPPPQPAPTNVRIQGGGGKCLDVQWGSSANQTPLQLWGCNGTTAQNWAIHSDGTIRALGKCMDARGDGRSNGTVIQIFDCNGGGNQKWESINVSGNTRMLRNPRSGRCLDAINGGTADGTRIQLYDCVTTTSAQRWTFVA